MRRFQVSGLILTSFFLASAGRAPAEETPRALIEKAIRAHGGQEKLARYKAVRTKTRGSMDVNGISVTYTSRAAAQLPSQLRNELSVSAGGIKVAALEVLSGDKAWLRAMGETQELSEERVAELRETLYAAGIGSLTPLLEAGAYTLTPLASLKVQGRPALGVRVVSERHKDIDLYFDDESGLLVMSRRRSLDANGKGVLLETFYRDFKKIDGLQTATRLLLFHDGKKAMEGFVTEIQFVDKLEDGEFARP